MKKILLLLTLISFSAISQNNPALFRNGIETIFTKYRSYTTAERDALALGSTDRRIIHHLNVSPAVNQYEQWDGDSWEELGAIPDLSPYQLKPSEGAFVDGDKDNLDNLVTADSNNVKITGDQTISGVKTFTSPPLLEQGALYKPFTGAFVFNPTGGSFFYGGASKYTFSQNNDDLGALAERYATFDFSNLTGATSEEKIYTFQDGSGTMAFISDIPTAINAANVIVSPAIVGETDAYAVMLANRTSIDSIQANMAGGVNTAYRTVTYSATISEAYDEVEPNIVITLTGDIDVTITGTVNGDSGFLMLKTTSTHTINLNGLTDLATTGNGGTMYFAYMHDVDGLEWFRIYKEAPKLKAEVVTSATIAMEGYIMYDDQTADAGTITLSDCEAGESLTVYINRASAPTLAGSGLTFNQLPNTTAFTAATEMAIYFEVAYDGTTIDYFYYER